MFILSLLKKCVHLSLEKEFEGAASGGKCNSAIDFELYDVLGAQFPVDSFFFYNKYLFSGTLHDFNGFQLVSIAVSFVTSA